MSKPNIKQPIDVRLIELHISSNPQQWAYYDYANDFWEITEKAEIQRPDSNHEIEWTIWCYYPYQDDVTNEVLNVHIGDGSSADVDLEIPLNGTLKHHKFTPNDLFEIAQYSGGVYIEEYGVRYKGEEYSRYTVESPQIYTFYKQEVIKININSNYSDINDFYKEMW